MYKSKNIAFVSKECVACGSCLKVCPVNAVAIYKGMYATINIEKCIGCGSCARTCPAAVISIILRGGVKTNEKALV